MDRALVQRRPFRHIAAQHGVSTSALVRHHDEHLPALLAQAKTAAEVAGADQLIAELRTELERVDLLYDACDRWLRDPDDPARYDIGPRDSDVRVIYSEPGAGGRTVQRKAKLSLLLARLEDKGVQVDRAEWRHADPRKLILETFAQLAGSRELLAKLAGLLDDRPQINVLVAPEWLRLRAELVAALEPFPDARQAVAARLVALEAA